MLAVTVTAAIAVAAYGRGQLLLTWDEPIHQFTTGLRVPLLDRFFLGATLLGGTSALLPLAATGAALTWNRCRAVAITLLVATAGRFVVELGLKLLIGRKRPDFSPLADYGGFAFPSGHVLGAVMFWGFLPVVVSVFTERTLLRRAANVAAMAVILTVAASRMYLGVHWFSDIMAGLAIGAVLLVAAEALLDHLHPRRGCEPHFEELSPPVSPLSASRPGHGWSDPVPLCGPAPTRG